MTEQPYTDADLRTEAARQYHVHVTTFSSDVVLHHLLDAPVESTRSDSDVLTWDEALNCGEFDEPTAAVRELIQGAADVSAWAVNLGADGLEPDGRALNPDAGVRIHFAFGPDVPEDVQRAWIDGIHHAIREGL